MRILAKLSKPRPAPLLAAHFSRTGFNAQDETSGETSGKKQAETVADVRDAMSFSIRKIEILRALVRFAEPDPDADPKSRLFPDYRLAIRLGNIGMSFQALYNCVKTL
ncbi:MAG: hypothetical protein LBG26_04285 [Treponema sp.]|jgi:hypothetical protein|nr:hypothetical protein [Treponema sp.]